MKQDDVMVLDSPIIPELTNLWEPYLHEGEKIEKPKGYVLLEKNKKSKHLYYLDKGEIAFTHTYMNGKQRLIGKALAPSLIGETSFFVGSEVMATPVIMHTACTLYAFDEAWVYGKMMPHYHELTESIIQNLSLKLMKLVQQKIFLNADELQVLICKLLKENLSMEEGKLYSKTNLTQVELANFLGAHKVSVNKIITKLKNNNIIDSYSKNKTLILDLEKLNAIVEKIGEH